MDLLFWRVSEAAECTSTLRDNLLSCERTVCLLTHLIRKWICHVLWRSKLSSVKNFHQWAFISNNIFFDCRGCAPALLYDALIYSISTDCFACHSNWLAERQTTFVCRLTTSSFWNNVYDAKTFQPFDAPLKSCARLNLRYIGIRM